MLPALCFVRYPGSQVVVTREAGHGMDCCVGMGAAPEFGDGFEEKAELHPRDFVAISEADDIQVSSATARVDA